MEKTLDYFQQDGNLSSVIMLLRHLIHTFRKMDVWIGSKFETITPHILILGESTWGSSTTLQSYIPRWLSGLEVDLTFDRLTKGCTSSKVGFATGLTAAAFWDAIAFYNFVPGSIGPTNTPPSPMQFQSGKRPLHYVLEVLRPDGVFILGRRQIDYSRSIVTGHGIPSVVIKHPGRSPAPAPIADAWDALIRVCE